MQTLPVSDGGAGDDGKGRSLAGSGVGAGDDGDSDGDGDDGDADGSAVSSLTGSKSSSRRSAPGSGGNATHMPRDGLGGAPLDGLGVRLEVQQARHPNGGRVTEPLSTVPEIRDFLVGAYPLHLTPPTPLGRMPRFGGMARTDGVVFEGEPMPSWSAKWAAAVGESEVAMRRCIGDAPSAVSSQVGAVLSQLLYSGAVAAPLSDDAVLAALADRKSCGLEPLRAVDPAAAAALEEYEPGAARCAPRLAAGGDPLAVVYGARVAPSAATWGLEGVRVSVLGVAFVEVDPGEDVLVGGTVFGRACVPCTVSGHLTGVADVRRAGLLKARIASACAAALDGLGPVADKAPMEEWALRAMLVNGGRGAPALGVDYYLFDRLDMRELRALKFLVVSLRGSPDARVDNVDVVGVRPGRKQRWCVCVLAEGHSKAWLGSLSDDAADAMMARATDLLPAGAVCCGELDGDVGSVVAAWRGSPLVSLPAPLSLADVCLAGELGGRELVAGGEPVARVLAGAVPHVSTRQEAIEAAARALAAFCNKDRKGTTDNWAAYLVLSSALLEITGNLVDFVAAIRNTHPGKSARHFDKARLDEVVMPFLSDKAHARAVYEIHERGADVPVHMPFARRVVDGDLCIPKEVEGDVRDAEWTNNMQFWGASFPGWCEVYFDGATDAPVLKAPKKFAGSQKTKEVKIETEAGATETHLKLVWRVITHLSFEHSLGAVDPSRRLELPTVRLVGLNPSAARLNDAGATVEVIDVSDADAWIGETESLVALVVVHAEGYVVQRDDGGMVRPTFARAGAFVTATDGALATFATDVGIYRGDVAITPTAFAVVSAAGERCMLLTGVMTYGGPPLGAELVASLAGAEAPAGGLHWSLDDPRVRAWTALQRRQLQRPPVGTDLGSGADTDELLFHLQASHGVALAAEEAEGTGSAACAQIDATGALLHGQSTATTPADEVSFNTVAAPTGQTGADFENEDKSVNGATNFRRWGRARLTQIEDIAHVFLLLGCLFYKIHRLSFQRDYDKAFNRVPIVGYLAPFFTARYKVALPQPPTEQQRGRLRLGVAGSMILLLSVRFNLGFGWRPSPSIFGVLSSAADLAVASQRPTNAWISGNYNFISTIYSDDQSNVGAAVGFSLEAFVGATEQAMCAVGGDDAVSSKTADPPRRKTVMLGVGWSDAHDGVTQVAGRIAAMVKLIRADGDWASGTRHQTRADHSTLYGVLRYLGYTSRVVLAYLGNISRLATSGGRAAPRGEPKPRWTDCESSSTTSSAGRASTSPRSRTSWTRTSAASFPRRCSRVS